MSGLLNANLEQNCYVCKKKGEGHHLPPLLNRQVTTPVLTPKHTLLQGTEQFL